MVPRHEVTVPVRRRSRVMRRRRQNFERLLSAAGVTFIAGFVPHLHWIWFVNLAVDAALGFYVTRLLAYKRAEVERRHTDSIPPIQDEPIDHASSL
ncbi:MAG: hypothetical protein E6G68_08665 [Actinobacteria bacterium]|nr:MAG: hypothetical protein E6G68_08665 [Actinomycetota bacterium]